MRVEHVALDEVVAQADRFGVRVLTGDPVGVPVLGVRTLRLDELDRAEPGHLVVATTGTGAPARAYQIDIAVRRALAGSVAALVLPGVEALPETARTLAAGGALPVLTARAEPAELAVLVDRLVGRGAAGSLARAEHAVAAVAEALAADPSDARTAVLGTAGTALGAVLRLDEVPGVRWTDPDAVCIGEVPLGRLVADRQDPAVALALPVVASMLSRALARETQDRFGPVRSRADLVVELLLADTARIDAIGVDAARAGLPVALSHTVAWLVPRYRPDPLRRPPAALAATMELRALQLVDARAETWHVATFHDDLVVVASEETGAPDHQRRLRDVAERLAEHARAVAGDGWTVTVGLGTPQGGAAGLRQSASEARVAAESAVAAGRYGAVEVSDVTGLRRVLLDFHASPLSRSLLDDLLAPLDALGAEPADTAVRTLLAYLSTRNSLARAAALLTLHPNAVNYRVRRIERTLALDLDDPDTRFALELACRLRLVAGG
ncbi:PucR family transcriptional regulator [Cellulomonas triticagri]|uniref:PucR family transcriptional regulator n=1 Tax=Cellulomonas triticagri TaxID=2483352 RepID=UPI0018F64000|nr:helix-turn-helix domain-containing protein [Cellulomonas triticagri]